MTSRDRDELELGPVRFDSLTLADVDRLIQTIVSDPDSGPAILRNRQVRAMAVSAILRARSGSARPLWSWAVRLDGSRTLAGRAELLATVGPDGFYLAFELYLHPDVEPERLVGVYALRLALRHAAAVKAQGVELELPANRKAPSVGFVVCDDRIAPPVVPGHVLWRLPAAGFAVAEARLARRSGPA